MSSKKIKLSKEIDGGDENEAYDLNNSGANFYQNEADRMMQKSVLDSKFSSKESVPPYEISRRQTIKQRHAEREKTMGKDWFNMKVGDLTDEAKNDLSVLKMRSGLFKDKFFKKNDSAELPKYFEMGKIIDNPVDYYTDRVPKKQQKQTILEELIEDAHVRKFAKKHYGVLQAKEEKKRKALQSIMKRRQKSKK